MDAMTAEADIAERKFEPGTTGWCADDLDDPEIERLWNSGRYEIVEGVLTKMPPALFDGSAALQELLHLLRMHLDAHQPGGKLATEVDVILGQRRVPVVDAVYLTAADQAKQKQAYAAQPVRRKGVKYGRILVPPTLVIESISLGHEAHDRETKREWYAEAGIPNYWLLDAQDRSLECLVLDAADYRTDQSGRDGDELRPGAFPGLILPLGKLWAE